MKLLILKLIMTIYVIVDFIDGIKMAKQQQQQQQQLHGRAKYAKIDKKFWNSKSKSKYQKFAKIFDPTTPQRSIEPGMCDSVVDLNEGDISYVFSDSFSTTNRCTVKFKSPSGTTLNVLCPLVNLDSAGCTKERLMINNKNGNSVTACKNYGKVSLIGTTNYLVLRYYRTDDSTYTEGFFCMISTQSEFKTGNDNSMINLDNDEIGYIIDDQNQHNTKISINFQGPPQSTLTVLCPMVELNQDGCNHESLSFIDTYSDQNTFHACQVSCKASLSTTSNDLSVLYRRKKELIQNGGYYCIILVNPAPPTTTTTIEPPVTTNICSSHTCDQVMQPRIAGGGGSVIKEFPHSALIYFNLFGKICHGSILNKRFILTTGYCMSGESVATIEVYLGITTLSEIALATPVFVESIIVHPGFAYPHINDVGLLKLVDDLTFSDKIQPICIVDVTIDRYVNEKGEVAGWGSTSFGGTLSDFKKGLVTIHAEAECTSPIDFSYQFCAGDVGMDTCDFEMGTPLLIDINGVNYQLGMMSFGSDTCGVDPYARVYVKISYFLGWIIDEIGSVGC